MKNSSGFLLIETATVFLLTGILLLGAVKLYGSGIHLQQQKQQAEQAWQMGQKRLFGEKTDADWQITENSSTSQGLMIKEIRIMDNEGKICCNLVWVEK